MSRRSAVPAEPSSSYAAHFSSSLVLALVCETFASLAPRNDTFSTPRKISPAPGDLKELSMQRLRWIFLVRFQHFSWHAVLPVPLVDSAT